MDADIVVVADILRPRGNRGEVLALSQSDVPGRLQTLKRANARLATGEDVAVEIEASWPHKELWVLKFSGIDSISAAERFRGAELQVAKSDRGKLADGEYFQGDLMGCAVVEKSSGKLLGVVEGWQQYGGPPLMEVKVDGREVLIPFVGSICQQVDLVCRRITVDLPEGLLDL
jgi:16S rRNA processing protein RimM